VTITNLDLITDAYRDVNAIDETQVPNAEQGQRALRKLNQMLAMWEGADEAVKFSSWFPQDDVAATCPIPEYAEAGVTGQLSIALAASLGLTVSAELVASAEAGYAVILRKAVNDKLQPVDMTHLPRGEMNHSGQNILTDQ
jgi:hypothetical protein